MKIDTLSDIPEGIFFIDKKLYICNLVIQVKISGLNDFFVLQIHVIIGSIIQLEGNRILNIDAFKKFRQWACVLKFTC